MMAFFAKLPADRKLLVSYERFVADIEGTTAALMDWLHLPVDTDFSNYLAGLGRSQTARDRGYENAPHQIDGLDLYKEFVQFSRSAPALSSSDCEGAN